jgi:putative membrane protein
MFRFAAFFGLLGLAAATGLIAWHGYALVLKTFASAGWGILWTSLFHLVPMLLAAIGWRALFPGENRPSLAFVFRMLWIRASVNNLMPVARIGGEIVAARLMIKAGMQKASSIATIVVEMTTSIFGVFLFDVIGISLVIAHAGRGKIGSEWILGLLLTIPVLIAFVLAQRVGLFGLLGRMIRAMVGNRWNKIVGETARLDRAVITIYKRWQRVAFCAFMEFASWTIGATEIWLAMHFLGHPIPVEQAIMIEAIIQVASSAAFLVPGALGVQELAFVFIGKLLGIPEETCLAMALVRRCRDLILYVPGLIFWQLQEGSWLLRGRKGSAKEAMA